MKMIQVNLTINVPHKGVNMLDRDGLAMLYITVTPRQFNITATLQVELLLLVNRSLGTRPLSIYVHVLLPATSHLISS